MSSWTFSPVMGWPVGGTVAAVMLALAVVEVVLHVVRRRSSDETTAACVRRVLLVVVVAVMALTPSRVTSTTSRAVNATDVVVAVDVTGSMAVSDARYGTDQPVSRLDAARQAVHGLTAMYADASFAAVRFGASGTLDVPLTPDTLAIDNWADTLSVEATSVSAGSSLDAPLDQLLITLRSIREQRPDDAIILYLITDGEQTSNRTRRTFSTLRRYLDDALVIGVGSTEGGMVPLVSDGVDGTADGQWAIDPATGEPGISVMDTAGLEELADEMSGGTLLLDAMTTIDAGVSKEASDRWRVTETSKERTRLTPAVWPLAIAAVALLAWELGAWLALSRRML